MTDEPDVTVDATGRLCPLPVLDLAKAMALAADGATVLLLADDPAAAADVAAFCRMRGHALVSSEPPRFVVRRGG